MSPEYAVYVSVNGWEVKWMNMKESMLSETDYQRISEDEHVSR